jgi:glycosyltransferase involved in cell wall biosynthesis
MIDTRGRGGILSGFFVFSAALLRVVQLRLSGRLDILHINLVQRGSTVRKFIFTALARALGVPTVVHLHGSGFDIFYGGLPLVLQAIVRGMFASAERIVVLGEGWRRFVVGELRVPGSKVVVIRNGTAIPAARGILAARSVPHILFLGQLGVRKGVPELLQALGSPLLRDRPWRATLAGNGARGRFMREAERIGIAGRLEFPGWVDVPATERLLDRSDILVLPSHREGLPMAVVEAMAHGLAVVTTPVGATPEILGDGAGALLVPPGNQQALAAALARLLDDPALRQRLGEQARKVFREKLDIEILARRLQQVYAAIRSQG